jgi:nucleotidyltransferase substrate binding protein (TIGR01987 family)
VVCSGVGVGRGGGGGVWGNHRIGKCYSQKGVANDQRGHMGEETDVRWKQRLQNYKKALSQLQTAVRLAHSRSLSELEQQGLIQAFEFTHELAWNLMKDYLECQGAVQLVGSRDSSREAFKRGMVADGEPWMEMIRSRNLTYHSYNSSVAKEIITKIMDIYAGCFEEFEKHMTGLESAYV